MISTTQIGIKHCIPQMDVVILMGNINEGENKIVNENPMPHV